MQRAHLLTPVNVWSDEVFWAAISSHLTERDAVQCYLEFWKTDKAALVETSAHTCLDPGFRAVRVALLPFSFENLTSKILV